MTRAKKTTLDPLRRPCPSCGVREGEGCKVTGTPDIRVPKASRLVHADRLALVEPVKKGQPHE